MIILQTINSMKEAYVVILEFASKIFKNEAGGLLILDKNNNLNLVSSWGKLCRYNMFLMFPAENCLAIENGITHFYEKDKTGTACKHVNPRVSQKHMCIPIVAPGETFGILFIQPKDVAQDNWPEEYKKPVHKEFCI